MKAWHFVGDTLRDGSPIPADGKLLHHTGSVAICRSGLHASERIIDALTYAPGNIICRVECGGIVDTQSDKLVCRERTILWRIDCEEPPLLQRLPPPLLLGPPGTPLGLLLGMLRRMLKTHAWNRGFRRRMKRRQKNKNN